jgi:ribosome-associated protein
MAESPIHLNDDILFSKQPKKGDYRPFLNYSYCNMSDLGDLKINPDEIHLDFIRSSGPGGQNVNKVASAVQLRFQARDSKSISPEIKERLLLLAGKRATTAGEIIIEARKFRTQQANREDALKRLYQLIKKASIPPSIRHKTRPSTASKLKRKEEKKRRANLKQFRTKKDLRLTIDD